MTQWSDGEDGQLRLRRQVGQQSGEEEEDRHLKADRQGRDYDRHPSFLEIIETQLPHERNLLRVTRDAGCERVQPLLDEDADQRADRLKMRLENHNELIHTAVTGAATRAGSTDDVLWCASAGSDWCGWSCACDGTLRAVSTADNRPD